MVVLEVLDQVGVRTGAAGMAQAGDDAGHVGGFGCAAKLRDDVRPNKAATPPSAKAHEVGPAFDGLQAVVADLQAQAGQLQRGWMCAAWSGMP
jgi:hypothetical protein